MSTKNERGFPPIEVVTEVVTDQSRAFKVVSVGVGLSLVDTVAENISKATRMCRGCPVRNDRYVSLGSTPVQVACTGFEEDVIAALRVVGNDRHLDPALLQDLPNINPPPCGVDIVKIVSNAIKDDHVRRGSSVDSSAEAE